MAGQSQKPPAVNNQPQHIRTSTDSHLKSPRLFPSSSRHAPEAPPLPLTPRDSSNHRAAQWRVRGCQPGEDGQTDPGPPPPSPNHAARRHRQSLSWVIQVPCGDLCYQTPSCPQASNQDLSLSESSPATNYRLEAAQMGWLPALPSGTPPGAGLHRLCTLAYSTGNQNWPQFHEVGNKTYAGCPAVQVTSPHPDHCRAVRPHRSPGHRLTPEPGTHVNTANSHG